MMSKLIVYLKKENKKIRKQNKAIEKKNKNRKKPLKLLQLHNIPQYHKVSLIHNMEYPAINENDKTTDTNKDKSYLTNKTMDNNIDISGTGLVENDHDNVTDIDITGEELQQIHDSNNQISAMNNEDNDIAMDTDNTDDDGKNEEKQEIDIIGIDKARMQEATNAVMSVTNVRIQIIVIVLFVCYCYC